MKEKIPTAILGANGYTGSTLLRLLLNHPYADLRCITSRKEAGKKLTDALPELSIFPKSTALTFSQPTVQNILDSGAKVVFLALPHGVSIEYVPALLEAKLKVIDLSADYRLRSAGVYEEFYGQAHPQPQQLQDAVYGLTEVYPEQIKQAPLIACPGCYPTSILLPLIPLLKEKILVPKTIHVTSMSGVSGAGKNPSTSLLFVECNESVRPYSVPKHRHLSEIEQELSLAADQDVQITFLPHLVPINTGISTNIVAQPSQATQQDTPENLEKKIHAAYQKAYPPAETPFVQLLGTDALPDTKNVRNTNHISIAWRVDPRTNRILLFSAIDNLIKGAAGQAIQNFNLLHDLTQTTAL